MEQGPPTPESKPYLSQTQLLSLISPISETHREVTAKLGRADREGSWEETASTLLLLPRPVSRPGFSLRKAGSHLPGVKEAQAPRWCPELKFQVAQEEGRPEVAQEEGRLEVSYQAGPVSRFKLAPSKAMNHTKIRSLPASWRTSSTQSHPSTRWPSRYR